MSLTPINFGLLLTYSLLLFHLRLQARVYKVDRPEQDHSYNSHQHGAIQPPLFFDTSSIFSAYPSERNSLSIQPPIKSDPHMWYPSCPSSLRLASRQNHHRLAGMFSS